MIEGEPVKHTGMVGSLYLGNQIALRCAGFIRERYGRERHRSMFLAEARRLSETHWKTAVTPRRDLLGNWIIDRDYAEALKHAAWNMAFLARQERDGKEWSMEQ